MSTLHSLHTTGFVFDMCLPDVSKCVHGSRRVFLVVSGANSRCAYSRLDRPGTRHMVFLLVVDESLCTLRHCDRSNVHMSFHVEGIDEIFTYARDIGSV